MSNNYDVKSIDNQKNALNTLLSSKVTLSNTQIYYSKRKRRLQYFVVIAQIIAFIMATGGVGLSIKLVSNEIMENNNSTTIKIQDDGAKFQEQVVSYSLSFVSIILMNFLSLTQFYLSRIIILNEKARSLINEINGIYWEDKIKNIEYSRIIKLLEKVNEIIGNYIDLSLAKGEIV